MRRARSVLWVFAALIAAAASAKTTHEYRTENPDLFHPVTGFRIDRQRGPTPEDIPGSARVTGSLEARRMIDAGAVPIDVNAADQSRYDELDGTWLVSTPHESLPGAIWLPEVGRGVLTEDMQIYLATELRRAAPRPDTPLVVFCISDCWMSWNAAQRIASMGYDNVHWYPLGTDGWIENGWDLEPVTPRPVSSD